MSNIEYTLVPSTEYPGKFALNHPSGRALSSGNALEIFIDNSWQRGRVEHAWEHGGYCWMTKEEDHIVPLKEGMIVRIPD